MSSPSPAPPRSPRNIVVIGAGIIGSCTAYYLTRHPAYDPHVHSITLLEANAIASGASGKAGGLLAKWAYPAELVELSWRLHEGLAAEHAGEETWGFRRVDVAEVSLRGRPKGGAGGRGGGEGVSLQKCGGASKSTSTSTSTSTAETPHASLNTTTTNVAVPSSLDFFHGSCIRSYSRMGSPANTAQVHPYQFTTAMASLALAKGAQLVLGKAVQMLRDEQGGNVVGVRYVDNASQEERIVEATDVVIAAGPWSSTPGLWPGKPTVGGLRAHSVVVRPARTVAPWAVFTRIERPDPAAGKGTMRRATKTRAAVVAPEIYTRPDNTVYMCGEGDTDVPLPQAGTAAVRVDEARCEEIVQAVTSVSDVLGVGDGEVVVRQACYLPVVDGGEGPLVGWTATQGVLLAAGHSCWGIMNGPATGLLISEFVFDGQATSADVAALDPRDVS